MRDISGLDVHSNVNDANLLKSLVTRTGDTDLVVVRVPDV